jgi:hypothetical protein
MGGLAVSVPPLELTPSTPLEITDAKFFGSVSHDAPPMRLQPPAGTFVV